MMNIFGSGYNSILKKIENGKCRIALNGKIAVSTSSGYKTYDPSTGTLTNCNQFVSNLGDDLFYVVPATKVKKGDIILLPSGPCCVIKAEKNLVNVIHYESGTYMSVAPERQIFMGNLYFYEKIVSPMKGMFGKGKMPKLLKMMMLNDMMGQNSNSETSQKSGGMGNLMQMMMMNSMMKDLDFFGEDLFGEFAYAEADEEAEGTDDGLGFPFFDADDSGDK